MMAKDGTNRGGARPGAGRKPKPREVKQDFQIPQFKEYLAEEQKGGGKTCAERIYQETYDWLKAYDCAEAVNSQLVESFAQLTARHIQAEEAITKSGFLSRHPTTGEPIPNPFIRISLDYFKAAQQICYQLQQVVNEREGAGTGEIMSLFAIGGDFDESEYSVGED